MEGDTVKLPKDITLTEWTCEFYQENDTCEQHQDTGQVLTITATDGGGGHYLVLQTDRWAVDTPQDLVALMEGVLQIGKVEGRKK